ncbi:MAG: hypothetical protein CME71_00290 [Halobacteriovorax sp.]|nr:hypothetical protein [Halobacteriovorax sp.]|tara:strand:- start:836 stop:1180 length:345 start_codon:yes stop_codon:yes gene_type:complete
MFITEDRILIGSAIVLFSSMIFIGSTLSVGIMTGLMSSMGLAIILIKVQNCYPHYWAIMCKHPILSDFTISTTLFMLVASSTATGVIAGASASLFASIGLTMWFKYSEEGLTTC